MDDRLRNKSFLENQSVETVKSPRPEQREDTDKIIEELIDNDQDRVQIRAACGMGKTLTGQLVISELSDRLAQQTGSRGRFMVCCPTIELARQIREDYVSDGVVDPDCLSIHDESADFAKTDSSELDAKQSEALDKFFTDDDYDKPKVLFVVGTPTSISKVAKAQQRNDASLDAAIFDEAHNLGGEVGVKKKNGAITERPHVFFNEEKDGVQIDKRVFMTATPRVDAAESPFSGGGGSAATSTSLTSAYSTYMRIAEGSSEDKMYLDQSDTRFFGKMVASHSYAEAVSAGYLNPVDAHEITSTIKNPSNLPIHRKGVVDVTTGEYLGDRALDKRSMAKKSKGSIRQRNLEDNEMTVGAYQSTVSIIKSLSEDSHGSSNVLSFSDNIEEARQVAERKKFERVAKALASDVLGGEKPPTLTEARRILGPRSRANDAQRTAARMVLVGKYAQLMHTSSKDSPEEQRKAVNFLDKVQPGESVPVDMWVDGWNPSPKILCNVNRLSEGVNIPSVDRVVLNRPSLPSDSAIYQAVGRASRKWEDENGESKKPRGRVIIPSSEEMSRDQTRRSVMQKDKTSTIRAINDVYYDAGPQQWRDHSAAENVPDEKKLRMRSPDGSSYDINDYSAKSMTAASDNMSLEAMNAVVTTFDKAQNEARRKAGGAAVWQRLQTGEKNQRTMVALFEMSAKDSKVDLGKSAPFVAEAIGRKGITSEDIAAYKMILSTPYRKRDQDPESLTEDERRFLEARREASKRKKFNSHTASTDTVLRDLYNAGMIDLS